MTAAITGGAGDHGDELLRIGREVVERRLQLGVHLRLMAFISAGWFSVVVVARSAFSISMNCTGSLNKFIFVFENSQAMRNAMSMTDRGVNVMTESFDSNESIVDAIRTLRGKLFSFGGAVPWEEFRRRIRHLLIERHPTLEERLQLLEMYDIVVTRFERQCGRNRRQLRRLGTQRALDTLSFLFGELRRQAGDLGGITAAALVAREREAGRLRVDAHLDELISLLLPSDHGEDQTPKGVR